MQNRTQDDAHTLVVLGDSTAAGIGDPVGPGRFRGFGPLLAGVLGGPGSTFLNTAESGARVVDVLRDQVPVAVAARPDVAVLVVGLNDTLRADFDLRVLREELDAVVAALGATGATVLTVRYHHHGRVFPLPRPLARALDTRIDGLNGVIDRVVQEHAVRCVDLAALPASYEPSTWSVDRLHPSARGHRVLARCFAELLAAVGYGVRTDLLVDGDDVLPTRLEEVHWLLTKGVPWLCRRSRDLVPLLVTVMLRRAGLPDAVPDAVPGEVGAERP